MTEFEKKLLTDLRNGKSVDAILNKFNETLTKVNEEYQAENRRAAQAKAKAEEERRAAEKRAKEQEKREINIKNSACNMDAAVRLWAQYAIPGVTRENVKDVVPQVMLDAIRDATAEIVEPMASTGNFFSNIFDFLNKSEENGGRAGFSITVDENGKVKTQTFGDLTNKAPTKSDEQTIRDFLNSIL